MAVTRLEAGSTRESDLPPRFATQTAPAPAATATGSSPTEIERACERAWKVAFGVEAPPHCLKQAVAMRGTGAP